MQAAFVTGPLIVLQLVEKETARCWAYWLPALPAHCQIYELTEPLLQTVTPFIQTLTRLRIGEMPETGQKPLVITPTFHHHNQGLSGRIAAGLLQDQWCAAPRKEKTRQVQCRRVCLIARLIGWRSSSTRWAMQRCQP